MGGYIVFSYTFRPRTGGLVVLEHVSISRMSLLSVQVLGALLYGMSLKSFWQKVVVAFWLQQHNLILMSQEERQTNCAKVGEMHKRTIAGHVQVGDLTPAGKKHKNMEILTFDQCLSGSPTITLSPCLSRNIWEGNVWENRPSCWF